jgi:hypothetical protein
MRAVTAACFSIARTSLSFCSAAKISASILVNLSGTRPVYRPAREQSSLPPQKSLRSLSVVTAKKPSAGEGGEDKDNQAASAQNNDPGPWPRFCHAFELASRKESAQRKASSRVLLPNRVRGARRNCDRKFSPGPAASRTLEVSQNR